MKTIWERTKTEIKSRIQGHSYRMWIEPMDYAETKDGQVVLACPNIFSQKRVMHQYKSLIENAFKTVSGNDYRLSVVVSPTKRDGNRPREHAMTQLPLPKVNVYPHNGRFLRKEFTFDQFVVGENNDFAYSASLSLASGRNIHQSLFLLSQTGMGKSHLSQAIGHHILNEFPSEKVYYITAEDFSNEMIHAFRNDGIEKFKERYRNQCDVLLLEDVHYLSGKERTQIELALTLDALFSSGKKIIFSSCYLPPDIPKLHDKLRSRFLSGLISNIEKPEYQTRVRILKKKIETYGYVIPEEIIHYLASELYDDVRQLESGLIGVTAKASLLGAPIDMDLAQSVVKNIVRNRKNVTIDVIKKLVCKHYKISTRDIVSRSRKQSLVQPRQIAIYLSRKYTDSPLQTIGKNFNRYHATALHAIKTVEKGLTENRVMQKQVEFLCDKLNAGDF